MRVFIAGATGVLGRRVVWHLKQAGYDVVGLARSVENERQLDAMGAAARRADIFDAEAMCRVTKDCRGILHLATSIPAKGRSKPADWYMNDRLRREGTRNLLAAARYNGADFYIQEGLLNLYENRDGAWVDESTPIAPPRISYLQSAYDMEGMLNRAIAEEGAPVINLRFGVFYAPEAAHTSAMLAMLAARKMPVIAGGRHYWNLIHADDAARAVLHAVQNYSAARGHTFNITDGQPVMLGDLLRTLAVDMNAPAPRGIPAWLAALMIGGDTCKYLLASYRAGNARAQRILGWQPEYRDYRQGFRQVLQAAELQAV